MPLIYISVLLRAAVPMTNRLLPGNHYNYPQKRSPKPAGNLCVVHQLFYGLSENKGKV